MNLATFVNKFKGVCRIDAVGVYLTTSYCIPRHYRQNLCVRKFYRTPPQHAVGLFEFRLQNVDNTPRNILERLLQKQSIRAWMKSRQDGRGRISLLRPDGRQSVNLKQGFLNFYCLQSPEMEMVARGLEKHLKLEQREHLMNLYVEVCGEETHRSVAEALGLPLQIISPGSVNTYYSYSNT
ncbi:hypothetical protein POM88_027317 [Heracleum sosnowskyi]|uniref:Uncharacterized protein n=1 Tax=Heracleum sosnowskyi TaxID=360622 RepID=A0AAD8I886_9APIA|nr:hypothetical protein POM88_027317 [Heracleum sosnowskyi]